MNFILERNFFTILNRIIKKLSKIINISDDEFVEEEEDDEEDDIIYNPKNLPLGWDGKPIPYWLYKLHGLNIDYKCQICGNQVTRCTYVL